MHGAAVVLKEYLAPDQKDMAIVHSTLDSAVDFDINLVLDSKNNYTALHCAVQAHFALHYSRADVVEKLLANGASVHATDIDGNTALHLAAKFYCDYTIINLLLKAGADRSAKNHAGKTAYDMVCTYAGPAASFIAAPLKPQTELAELSTTSLRVATIWHDEAATASPLKSPGLPMETPIFTHAYRNSSPLDISPIKD
jgi:hypothetical protein